MKQIYGILIILLLFLGSCTKNFDALNEETKNPTKTEGEFLFSNAEKAIFDQISSTNVNTNVWKMFSQYWTETTYTDEALFDIGNRAIPDNTFAAYYRRILKPLKEAKTLIANDPITATETEEQKNNKLMIIELLEVYAYHNLTIIFGDVPYTEALNIENISPKYDDDAVIIADLIVRIDKAIAGLKDTDASFVSADLIYGGNVSAWIKFANSLKLKIAISVADADADISFSVKTIIEEAVTAGVFTSSADNALFAYTGSTPNNNPMNNDLILSGRHDFVVTQTLTDLLNSKSDSRIFNYTQSPVGFPFEEQGEDNPLLKDTTVEVSKYLVYTNITGEDSVVYKTAPFTLTPESDSKDKAVRQYNGGVYGASNSYDGYSHINGVVSQGDFAGILMTYNEVEFYIAEAAARGYSVGETAEEAFNNAVTAAFVYWGASTEAASTHLSTNPYTSYTTWQEAIGTESWIAFYTRGLEGYTQYRRLDYPVMYENEEAVTGGAVPTRFTYPVNEQTLNATNYSSAASAIGGDDLLTKLFWDKF